MQKFDDLANTLSQSFNLGTLSFGRFYIECRIYIYIYMYAHVLQLLKLLPLFR